MKRSFAKSMTVFKVTEREIVRGNFTNSMKQCIVVHKTLSKQTVSHSYSYTRKSFADEGKNGCDCPRA